MYYYVYVLTSLRDDNFFVGIDTDPFDAAQNHNRGLQIETISRRPLRLVYFEGFMSMADAQKRVQLLNSDSGAKFIRQQLKNYLQEYS